jgi:hypothetical protein
LLVASHTGYQRLPHPVLHRRKVFHLKNECWFVLDRAEGSGVHDFDLYWQLAPDMEWQRQSPTAIGRGPTGSVAVVTTEQLFTSQTVEPSWYSPVYGRRSRTQALRFHERSEAPAEFATVLLAGVALGHDTGTLLRAESGEREARVTAYTYCRQKRDHLLVFPSECHDWQWRGLTSDAAFVYYALAEDGGESLIMTGGSYVEVERKRIIDCARRVERIEISGPSGENISCSDSSAVKNVSREKWRVMERAGKTLGQGK